MLISYLDQMYIEGGTFYAMLKKLNVITHQTHYLQRYSTNIFIICLDDMYTEQAGIRCNRMSNSRIHRLYIFLYKSTSVHLYLDQLHRVHLCIKYVLYISEILSNLKTHFNTHAESCGSAKNLMLPPCYSTETTAFYSATETSASETLQRCTKIYISHEESITCFNIC